MRILSWLHNRKSVPEKKHSEQSLPMSELARKLLNAYQSGSVEDLNEIQAWLDSRTAPVNRELPKFDIINKDPQIRKLLKLHRHNSVSTKSVVPLKLSLLPISRNDRMIDFEVHGYQMNAFLANGSLGPVYLVEAIPDRTTWVAKCIDLLTIPEKQDAAQALLEAELLRRLDHPNVVAYRASFVTNHNLVLITEFCEMGDLHRHLQKLRNHDQIVPEYKLRIWLKHVAMGLQHIHEHKIIHCDVKSSNIFLDKHQVAKIGDLGIARELKLGCSQLSPGRCPRGTPVYMSPEMLKRSALTEQSDCWSLGCILYEMCHLKHAFPSQLDIWSPRSKKSDDGATIFAPGVTVKSDLSCVARQMLHNLRYDLKVLVKNSEAIESSPQSSIPQNRLTDNCGADTSASAQDFVAGTSYGIEALSVWKRPDCTTYARILPQGYSDKLNSLACRMLEPDPATRLRLEDILTDIVDDD